MLRATETHKIAKLELTVTRWLSVRAEGQLAITTVAVLALCATILVALYFVHRT